MELFWNLEGLGQAKKKKKARKKATAGFLGHHAENGPLLGQQKGTKQEGFPLNSY